METDAQVIIVGAGLAGLRCAIELQRHDIQAKVFEATDRIGGRVQTELFEGFRLDKGFQVLLTAYDECRSLLNYDSLRLGAFEPGALIWTGSKMEKVIDPWRRPKQLFRAAMSPIGTLRDKLRVGGLREKLRRTPLSEIYEGNETSTLNRLKEIGFSEAFIESFFRPFYGGIFLEDELETGHKMFEFVFKMFGQGFAALPHDGMDAIPAQMSEQLNPDAIHLNQRVAKLGKNEIVLESGTQHTARHVVLATDMGSASSLIKAEVSDRGWNDTYCHYYAAPRSPLPEPLIALNGSGNGNITNIAVPTDVNPGYSASGESLICVSTSKSVPQQDLTAELYSWFGNATHDFRFLKSYAIPHALPRQSPGDNAYGGASLRTDASVWICGDHRYSSSIQGTLASGRMVGEALVKTFSKTVAQ